MPANKALGSLAYARLRRFKCSLYIDLNEPPLSAVIILGLANGSLALVLDTRIRPWR